MGKANVVADALSQRAVSALIQDVCLRMTMMTLVLEMITDVQLEAINEENRKREQVIG